MAKITAGTWVEIEQIILTPGQRAPTLPEDTKKVPYVLKVSGFLLAEAELGAPARVRTLIGRELEGTLKAANPSYEHTFGKVVPELLTIGLEEDL
ncbi:MAG: 2-amino-4-oxopentanoate thiolase subunit OrtA [Brevefilum sp.]